MWMFWIVAGLLAAGACALVIGAAGRAAARAAKQDGEDPALPVYRRHLAELDDQAAQGLLDPTALAAARAEAGRRLLKSADTLRRTERPGGRRSRLVVLAGGAAAALGALAIYMTLGSPGLPDQPYRQRLKTWRQADPATLDPPRMAAVLRQITEARPQDPQAFEYLGRAEFTAGDGFAASRAFARAAQLAPGRAELYLEGAEALMADNGGKASPEARGLLHHALTIDPKNAAARYFLARARIADGDLQGGLADWRALAAEMSPTDPRRADLLAEIARDGAPAQAVSQAGPAQPAASAPGLSPQSPMAAGDAQQMGFIQAMVARQAAQLRAHPDDPEGWARLVRSYGVLGDKAAQADALAQARRQFAQRPDALARVEAEARSVQSAR